MTAFSFIDKAQKLITNVQGNEFYDGLASLLCIALFLYLFLVARSKKNQLNRRYLAFLLTFLLFFGIQYINAHKDYSYLSDEYAKLTTIYNNRDYKVTEGWVS